LTVERSIPSALFKKMEATLYGTPEDVTKVMSSVVNGQSMARTIGGFFEAADGKTLGVIDQLASGVRGLTEGIAGARRDAEGGASEDDGDEAPAANRPGNSGSPDLAPAPAVADAE
jgi:hypothetical protein